MAHEVLARLIAQAEGEGTQLVTLRALVEEASEIAVERALGRLGLADHAAPGDIGELRTLLAAWRDVKTSVRIAVVGWVVRVVLALLVLGTAVRLGG